MRVVSAGAGSLREDGGGPPWPIPSSARMPGEEGSGSGTTDQSGGGWGETVMNGF
jgi:hypothetical protein